MIDLLALQELCTLNYQRMRLLLQERSSLQGRLPGAWGEIRLQIEKLSPYTSTITLHWRRPDIAWWPQACWRLHMYHDAGMLEVQAVGDRRGFLVRHAQPHARGYARDEKWQVNHFLAEMLHQALRQDVVASLA